jgi:hypothetical protein
MGDVHPIERENQGIEKTQHNGRLAGPKLAAERGFRTLIFYQK